MGTATEAEPIERGRFGFGENWRRFAEEMPQVRIDAARGSLIEWLGQESLSGLSFLDIGSGSGLFSLGAAQLGADRIHSFDYDPDSVATTRGLKERFAPDGDWTVERGSALDEEYLASLGTWDVVYSWGVLHHTGSMWKGMDLACSRVKPGGRLFISIYNDQGRRSKLWKIIKRVYNLIPEPLRVPYAIVAMLPMELRMLTLYTLTGRPNLYVRSWTDHRERGMSRWHDMIDWVGGYPFEVATPDQVFEFCSDRGLILRKLFTAGGGHGCNQFVFERPAAEAS